MTGLDRVVEAAKARYGLFDPSPHDVLAQELGDDTPAYREAFRRVANECRGHVPTDADQENNRTCMECGGSYARHDGETVTRWRQRKYCSAACANEAKSYRRSA